jgi:hypothetical protein
MREREVRHVGDFRSNGAPKSVDTVASTHNAPRKALPEQVRQELSGGHAVMRLAALPLRHCLRVDSQRERCQWCHASLPSRTFTLTTTIAHAAISALQVITLARRNSM